MKKNLFVLFFAGILFFSFAMTACDDATSASNGYSQGIYTVDRYFLYPEMLDTFLRVDNISDFDLKDGDRAYLTLAYEYDNYLGASKARYYIKSVEAVLPVSGLTAAGDVDESIYSSSILGWNPLAKYGGMWFWKKYQNLSVVYYSNGNEGDFKLSPVKLSGDTLCFDLNAKIEDGDKVVSSILMFDVSSAANMLPAEDAEKLVELDSIYMQVALRWRPEGVDTVRVMYPTMGKYKNCF